MAVKLVKFGGTDWSDGDILYAADQGDTIERAGNEPWYKLKYSSNLGTYLIKWSATRWQSQGGITTDTGGSWASGGYGAVSSEDIAAVSGTAGIAADYSDGSASLTTDSGANWTAASTGFPNVTKIHCLSMGSTSVAVAGGIAAAGNYIWVSSDGGDTWAQATTGPTAQVNSIFMASATVGYATSGNDIWKTTDGGVNWTDTTDDFGGGLAGRMYCTDADTCYILDDESPILQKYVNSTNTVTTLLNYPLGDDLNGCSNIVSADNGNLYFIGFNSSRDGSTLESGAITLFKYDGTSVFQKPIGIPSSYSNAPGYKITNGANAPVLIEATDVLYCNIDGHILEINVENE